ncbi:hypothetical protein CC2G_006621 [Coprinopsis cinerea AmutBmut pab1-1]|nr:hypothetical protein CC2G_006621 [Coprinopsis cinerea AmutBmut pab1-1]
MAIESAARASSTTASASSLSFTLSSTHYATPSTSTSTSTATSIDASTTTPAALTIPPIDPTKFGPRTGVLTFTRPSSSSSPNADTDASASADFESITIETPGLLTTTSRGVVPHIAWDTYERHAEMGPLKWVNVPWESFLEHNPPVPTLFASSASATKDTNETKKPFHQFLGFKPRNHILSLSARDADDTKEMPPNGNDVVSVSTLRGVRKLTPTSYLAHIHALNPDLIFALHDTPFTNPPYSQKRLTKSIERSGAWIGTLLGLAPPSSGSGSASDSARGKKKKGPKQEKGTKGTEGEEAIETKLGPVQAPIIAPLIGSTSLPARAYYAKTLLEPFSALEYNNIYGVDPDGHNKSREGGKRIGCLDDGIAGYSFELRSLEKDLGASTASLPPRTSL